MGDEHDKLLPIANVGRIMKQILPPNAKISKEAKETIQECASEFISFVTGEASNKCRKDNRKTVNGHDVCWALISLGFDEYGEVIMKYWHKYMEFERERIERVKQRTVIEEEKDEDSMCRVPECRVMEKGQGRTLILKSLMRNLNDEGEDEDEEEANV
ncbi:hypothetical protein LguiA_026414 [Lonicera macranthoides]